MLTGAELAVAIAAVLVGAVGVGALLHRLWVRFAGVAASPVARLEQMSERLHEAEMAREAAELARQEAEAQLAQSERQAEERMAALEARLEGAVEAGEEALARELSEAWAELEAVRDGLARVRQRIHEPKGEAR